MERFLRFFCCLLLLASSLNSLENDDNSEEDGWNSQTPEQSIGERLTRFEKELRQSKYRKDYLKVEVEKIDKGLNEVKSTVDELKLQLNESDSAHDRHFRQLLNEINAINKVLKKHETLEISGIPITDFQKCNKSLNIERDKPAFTWVVNDLRAKMDLKGFEMESEIFPLKGYSMKARAQLSFKHINLLCGLSFKNSNKSSDDVLEVKLLPLVSYVFKNQSQLGHYNDIVYRDAYLPFHTTLKYDTYYRDYLRILIHSGYATGDTAVIDIYVETPEQAEQSCSEDGTIAWAIHDVTKGRKQERTENVLFHVSPYFYSSPKGYRMVSAINLNNYDGRHNRTGLTASTPVISGPYDNDLNKFFKINSTFTFLHPTDPHKNIVKSTVFKNTGTNYEMVYLANEEVDSLLLNDTLYYHVTTKVI